MTNFSYFLFVLIAIIVGVIVVKKITGCMIRLVIVSILVGLLVYILSIFLGVGSSLLICKDGQWRSINRIWSPARRNTEIEVI